MFQPRLKQTGFTIVELLVVIVVIGILAAITIVSYTGITQRARAAALQSDLKNAATVLEIDKTQDADESYPVSKEAANDGNGLKSSDSIILSYFYNSSSNSYCLEADSDGVIYYIMSDDKIPQEGTCPSVGVGSFARAWGGASSDFTESVIQTSDGGYAVAGTTYSFGSGDRDAFLAKYDASSDLSWVKTIGGTGRDNAFAVVQTYDEGFAVTGYTGSYGAGAEDAFLAKFDSIGDLVWFKTWGGASFDNAYSLVQTSDHGFAIAGLTLSYGAGGVDSFVARYDSIGDLVWSKTWGGSDQDQAESIIQTSDDGFAVVGYTNSYGPSNYNTLLMKYDSDGDLSWSKIWGGGLREYGESVIQTSDGGYAVSGSTRSYSALVGDSDAFLAKYDSSGDLSWLKTVGSIGDDGASSLVQTSDDGYAIAGSVDVLDSYEDDALIVRYDSLGNLSWSKTFDGGDDNDGYNSIVQTSDGGFAVAGSTNGYGLGGSDALISKYDSMGLISGCLSTICLSPSFTETSQTLTTTLLSPTVTTPSPTVTEPSPTVTTPSIVDTEIVTAV